MIFNTPTCIVSTEGNRFSRLDLLNLRWHKISRDDIIGLKQDFQAVYGNLDNSCQKAKDQDFVTTRSNKVLLDFLKKKLRERGMVFFLHDRDKFSE